MIDSTDVSFHGLAICFVFSSLFRDFRKGSSDVFFKTQYIN